MARFKVGDEIIVRDDLIVNEKYDDGCAFTKEMEKYKREKHIVTEVLERDCVARYHISASPHRWLFSESMVASSNESVHIDDALLMEFL